MTDDSKIMAETCLICDEDVECDRCEIREKGMQGLLKASVARKDGKQDSFRDKSSGVAHASCRASYIRPGSIAKFLREMSLECPPSIPVGKTLLRSSVLPFSFKTKCLFCCETIDDEFRVKQKKKPLCSRQLVYQVRGGDSMKENIAKCATDRGDKWGEEVLKRVNIFGELAATNAIYHDKCYKAFFTTKPTSQKRGRPKDDYVSKAMEEIYNYLEENDECQYSLEQIMNVISGEKPSYKTVKAKLFEKYSDRIVITQLHNRRNVICFRDVGNKILSDSWYDSKCNNEEDEKLRLVRTVAAIIKKDIQSQIYETDKYPASDSFFHGAQQVVPETLSVFLESLITSRKQYKQKTKKKEIAISHAIIHAVRPRSFISPVLHGLAFFIHRKYAAKNLINLLANFGFSASYNDAQILELSAIYHPAQSKPSGIFCQYVFDNADYNVATLDGLKTFHSMGGIECITPAQKLPPGQPIQKLSTPPSAKTVGTLGVIQLETYENIGEMGLKAINVEDLKNHYNLPDVPLPKVSDVLWIVGKWLGTEGVPEWKGYMRGLYEEESPAKSAVVPLPFINASPSDYSTIYTALKYAATQCQQQGMKTCYVTFDQPLYIKAREIVASCPNDPLLKYVVVRLGGFHLLMSFLGCIGHIMAGSGLKEVLATVFAANSVDKMLTGHAFSRAVRGHVLVQTALAEIILNCIDVSDEEKNEITKLLSQLKSEKLTLNEMKQNSKLVRLQGKLHNELNSLTRNGPTASLWVQYFHMITLMKEFIEAERSGNWESHLCSVQQMIPFFHASGHLQYAKCAHLYLQDMRTIPTAYPSHAQEFTHSSYFTVARSDSPGSGNWTDMTIEQVLMRGMKTHGGLTSGRGITDSVLAKWIGGASVSITICSALEDFAGLQFSTGEQHVDYRTSRQTRNAEDRKKMFDWFTQHPPFPQLPSLVSLSNGVVGNRNVNCHQALEVGKVMMTKMIGQNFGKIKQSRKDKVVSLASMGSTIIIDNVVEVVDPLLIFERIAISKKCESDLQNLLEYELAPFPLALFNDCGMRKTKKSALYDVFPVHGKPADLKLSVNVIDGGFLLHRVKWNAGSTFSFIFNQYVTYIKTHFGDQCTVVFDGYTDTMNSTKLTEQKRRGMTKTSVDIDFREDMTVTVPQEHFLANERNKTKFISMLSQKFIRENIETTTAKGDADTVIVRCGIDKALSEENVAIIGEDIDLLVLLVALAPTKNNILFVKPGRGKVETKTYSSLELQNLGFSKAILFIHAFSGCDTTSSIYRKGKAMIVKLFDKDESLTAIAEVFYDHSSTPEAVSQAGERMFLKMYNAHQTDLNNHRYLAFLRSANKLKSDLGSLPPTRGSAQQHAYRVFLQVQIWLGNQMTSEVWGWKRGVNGTLEPIMTNDPAAPDSIMKTIFCNCTAGCGVRCGCRKAGLKCTSICGNCEGSCTNRPPLVHEELHDDVADEPDL